MNLTSADIAGDREVIARADAIRNAVAAASAEIETTRRLPRDLLDRLHEARLFRLLLPRSTDGIETDPVTFFHAIETIARADASTAWCLSQAGGCAMSAAYLDLPVAQEVFADPRAVLAWGPGPKVKAVECEGGLLGHQGDPRLAARSTKLEQPLRVRVRVRRVGHEDIE